MIENKLTAIVIGSSGLVGLQLVSLLLEDKRFSKVICFTRKKSRLKDNKLEKYVVDFDKIEEWSHLIKGDVLFSALGTTLKKAGSKEAQYKVDFNYQFEVAKHAALNGVSNYLLVSSMGANINSTFFYTKMKGQLELEVAKLKFDKINIFRPGILAGNRSEKRLGEKLALKVIKGLNLFGILRAYKPIYGHQLAKAMINSNFSSKTSLKTYELDEIFKLIKD